MQDRNPDRPMTVVNRFEVKGDVEEFEREYRAHSQYLRSRADFDFLVTSRLVETPRVYVHLAHWRSLRGFLDTVHDDTFVAQAGRLGPKVHTAVDQTVSVRRNLRTWAEPDSAAVLLVNAYAHGDCDGLEKRFQELTDQCGRTDGFGGSDLLRSTVQPLKYTGLLWWRDAGPCTAALENAGFRTALDSLREIADTGVEHGRHVAYERAFDREQEA